MAEQYFYIDFDPERTLQDQVCEHLIDLILSGSLSLDQALPSSRRMSSMLKVSRTTVVVVYESLLESGYLVSKPRQGYFIAPQYAEQSPIEHKHGPTVVDKPVCWADRFKLSPGNEQAIVKPRDWEGFKYPFIYGQVQHDLFPIDQWRECAQKTLTRKRYKNWINDWVDRDDPLLIKQIQTRLLPRRGIYADTKQILVTIGTQNSLYLLANLLCNKHTLVGMENPGFRDAKSIFGAFDAQIQLQPVDDNGMQVNDDLNACDYLYLTPSHQVPTGAVLSQERRRQLLEKADKHDIVLIEDDYDAEINMAEQPLPALKAMDRNQRVVYIGSMSKAISPGLRLGYMVADEEFINEIRALRRLMYRHPPINNQQQLGLFVSQGYYDSYIRKIRDLNSRKLDLITQAIAQHLPTMHVAPISPGATSIWLRGAENLDSEALAWRAAQRSVMIEPGGIHFLSRPQPRNFFRLGFSAIDLEHIEAGIIELSKCLGTV